MLFRSAIVFLSADGYHAYQLVQEGEQWVVSNVEVAFLTAEMTSNIPEGGPIPTWAGGSVSWNPNATAGGGCFISTATPPPTPDYTFVPYTPSADTADGGGATATDTDVKK